MRCPICHHQQSAAEKQTTVYATEQALFAPCRRAACTACGSSWVVNPPPLDFLKKYYEEEGGGEFFSFLDRPAMALERCQAYTRWRFIREASTLPMPMTVCDIGAGLGCTYEVAKHERYPIDYFAYEISKKRRRRIETWGGKTEGNFLDNSSGRRFDLVWASHILEHYSDPDVLLQQISSLISPKGIGFIEIPCLDYEFKRELAPHLLFFSVMGLQKALERNGFSVLRIDSVGQWRNKAKEVFQTRSKGLRFKQKIKSVLPKLLIHAGAPLLALARGLAFKRPSTIAEDLAKQEIFEQWQLNVYGGDRSWIRAVFTCR